MATNASKRKGTAGVANAKNSPYRLVGGTHDRPLYFQPEMALARTVYPSDYRKTATYANGILGGILGKLYLGLPLSDQEQALIYPRGDSA